MTDTPGRLLRLLSLLQTPREWPGSELAERLAVSPRTIRRDVDRLRDLGYPVQASLGVTGGYRLVAGAAMPPLLLDDEEAVAVAVGLRTAARQAVSGIEEAALRALTKLEQVLPSRLRHRVRNLTTATVSMAPFGAPDPVDPELLTTLAAAITGRQRVRFGYRGHDGARSRRHVDPYRLVSAGRRWYLVGHDNDRDDWRIYRVDRIDGATNTGARTVPRQLPAPDAATYVHDKLFRLAPTYRAVATVHAPVEQVRGRLGDAALEPVDAHTCRLVSYADTLDWLAFRLTTLGCAVEVHEPPELRAHLRELGARALRAGGG
ncbi:helix-turn-helix transcriptional regulator [Micromonospora coxensis]|uniref:helix-turn-helix transcriptional regulator n=1 Tax=Micromonospora coxensis TaxID=356852 RepID=UPI003427FC3A